MPDTPLERALRDLVDASVSGDADDHELPVAGTALVVRDGDAGIQVLLIQRPDKGSFASAWVFPGGKVEASDRDGLSDDAAEEDVARRAAARETLEETGRRAVQGLLLHAVADLIDHREAEVDDVERVEHTDGVRQLGTQRGGVPAERIERSEGDLLAPGCLPGCSGRPTERPGQLRRRRLPDNRRLHRSQLLSGLPGKVASGKGNGRGPARSLGTGHRACVRVGPCQRRRRVNNPLDLKESRGST